MKRRIVTYASIAALVLAAWGGYAIWTARADLVTLDVHQMPVRQVVTKIQRQTWERIIVHNDVKGNVTLKVKRVPLNEVLNIISEQTDSRWTALYPLYTKGDSLVQFKKVARGDVPAENSSWTNLHARGRGGRFGGPGGPGGIGGFRDIVRGQNKLVTVQIDGKDLDFAVLALSRFTQAQVVPENGAAGTVNLRMSQAPFEKAVASLARQVNRKWDGMYTLQPQEDFFGRGERDGRGDREFARGDRRRGDETNRFEGGPRFFGEERRAEREREMEAVMATMTPEEKQKFEEDRKQMEEIRNLPPEERAQRFQEMATSRGTEFQQRMEQRARSSFLNSTPDQRFERAQRRAEMRNRRQQQQSR